MLQSKKLKMYVLIQKKIKIKKIITTVERGKHFFSSEISVVLAINYENKINSKTMVNNL